MVPPKVAISDLMGRVKGQTSMKLFKQFRYLRKQPYWGNHFWSQGYCVDTIGLDAEMISKYVKYQEQKDLARPLRGQGLDPPMGGEIKAGSFGPGFFTHFITF